jgi:hypothetical protein
MADLNALIAQGAQFAAPVDPFAQYGKMQQLEQGETANQLNRMKMDEYQRGLQEEGGLRNFLTKNTDLTKPETRAGLLQFGKTGLAYAKSLDEQNTAAATLANLKLAGVKTQGDVAELKRKLLDSSKRNMASNPSDENIIAHTQDYKLNPLFADDMLSIEATAQQLLAMPLDQRKLVLSGAGATAADLKPPAPPASVAEFERAQKDPKFMQFLQQRAAAGRAPATPSAPVAVVDPVSGKPIFVSREQAIRGGMSPASAQESLPPKEIQKREAALPAATSAMKGFESKSDSFIADLKALRDHPGLSSITGLVYGRTPSATREGRAAQALYDKVVAKGGFQALQDLRDASKTGGALGNVSNTEGAQLKSSFAAIDRTQDAPDVQAAIDQAISSIEGSKTRMREAYDNTYSYKAGNAPAAAPAGGPKVVDFGSLK